MKDNTEKRTKILAINYGGIGDQILFFPALKTLKESFYDPSITLVTEPRSKCAKELTSLARRVVICDVKGKHKYWNLFRLLLFIWTKGYDVVVSSGGSTFVSIFLFLTGIKKRYGYDTGLLSKILLSKAVPLNKQQYAGCMYHDLTKGINRKKKCSLPEIDVTPESLIWATEKIGKRDKQIIVIHPGVSKLSIKKNILKFWSAQSWAQLIMKLIETGKYKIILTGGPDDESVFQELKAELAMCDIPEDTVLDMYASTKDKTTVCSCGTKNQMCLKHLAALISLSNLMICVDSAPMHIAVGVRTPTVALFGPTDEKKLLPIDDYRFVAIKNELTDCRPCLWDKRQVSCGNPECLDIDPQKVFEAVERQLNG